MHVSLYLLFVHLFLFGWANFWQRKKWAVCPFHRDVFLFLEGGDGVLFSSSLFKRWTCILGLHALNQLIFPMNDLMSLFSIRVQHIPILIQKCPSKIIHQESVISLNLDLLRPKILQLENVQILEFSIFDFSPPPLPIYLVGEAPFSHVFFPGKLGALVTGNPINPPTGENSQGTTTFSNSSCGSMWANFLRALWHTRLEMVTLD